MEKKAVVLSGGGSKGSYQVGVWKALKKLHYNYKIVTGTSVGALNGALMVQRDYRKCLKLWENISFSQLFIDKFPSKVEGLTGKANVYKKYASNFLKKGGMDTTRFEQMVYKLYSPFRFFRSSVDFGLVTYNFTSKKPLEIKKEEMTNETAPLYIIASASCFPAFPMKPINGNNYIDGGYFDNMPINLAISMGATEIVAVDLNAVGRKQKVKKSDVKITLIEPRNQIVSFLVFDSNSSKKAIQYGYNDTMKAFGKLEGNTYTFYKGELTRYYQRYEQPLKEGLEKRLKTNKKTYFEEQLLKLSIFHKLLEDRTGIQRQKIFNETVELIGKNLKIDDTKIYHLREFSKEALYRLRKVKPTNLKVIEEKITSGKVKGLFGTTTILKYLYDRIEKIPKSKNHKNDYCRYALLFPKEFIAAIYLHLLNDKYQII